MMPPLWAAATMQQRRAAPPATAPAVRGSGNTPETAIDRTMPGIAERGTSTATHCRLCPSSVGGAKTRTEPSLAASRARDDTPHQIPPSVAAGAHVDDVKVGLRANECLAAAPWSSAAGESLPPGALSTCENLREARGAQSCGWALHRLTSSVGKESNLTTVG